MGNISELNARIDTAIASMLSIITRINNDRNFIDSGIMPRYSDVYDGSEGLLYASGIANCIHQMDRQLEAAIAAARAAQQALEAAKIQ